jgi:transcriptional regulator with XRE-family HTH domain
MTKEKGRSFGELIRERRRQLDLTQEEVARRIKTSTPYVGHLEADKRHPSDAVVTRLADVLGLDRTELFFLANPEAKDLIQQPENHIEGKTAWDEFSRDERMKKLHNVSPQEMEMLSQVALMGEVRSVRDFIYILNTVRQALAR